MSAVPAVQGVVGFDPDGALRQEPAGDHVLGRDAIPLHAAHPLADQLPGAGRVPRHYDVALGHFLVVETGVHPHEGSGRRGRALLYAWEFQLFSAYCL